MEEGTPSTSNGASRSGRGRRGRKLTIVAIVLLLFGVGVFVALDVAVRRAEPILRAKVIQTLSTRFDSRVELAEFHVSVFNGLQVSGGGLKLYPNHLAAAYPLFSVKEFHFATAWKNLLKTPVDVGMVDVDGLDIRLPPKQDRADLPKVNGTEHKLKIQVERIVVRNATLVIGTNKPGKLPLDFEIGRIDLTAQPSGMPWAYDATLVNPKPVGDIHAVGRFGPWQAESPSDTPLNGEYTFSHADLSDFKGIAGILASTGKFEGALNHIIVDGQADVPDFRLTHAGRPLPLHTTFHATVDGTNGDTWLQPVDAQLLHSHFVATGSVVRIPGRGHDISLDVVVDDGRIEDFLALAVRADRPLMEGSVQMKAKLDIPPEAEKVLKKIRLEGNFNLRDAHFTSDKLQAKLDELSMRGQGKPKEATDNIPDNVRSRMMGHFSLTDGRLALDGVTFAVPGADIALNGTYNLDGSQLDIHGDARLKATLSQMTTGWKSILLKPVDPFFSKKGAGTEIPFKVTGTRSDMQFGLDFHHKDKGDQP